jgi:hypothetical protein
MYVHLCVYVYMYVYIYIYMYRNIYRGWFIIFTTSDPDGTNQIRTPISLYKDGDCDDTLLKTLQIAASRGIPAVCANLDLVAVVPSGIAHMPGVLKSLYEGTLSRCNGDL